MGMARVRVSTTVDEKLLATARSTLSPLTDAALLDEALATLLDRHHGAEIDAAYLRRVNVDAGGGHSVPLVCSSLTLPWSPTARGAASVGVHVCGAAN